MHNCTTLLSEKQYFCRDSGFGNVQLSLWELEWDEDLGDYVRSPTKKPIIDNARSSQCTVEVRQPETTAGFIYCLPGDYCQLLPTCSQLCYITQLILQLSQVGGGPWWDVWKVKSKMSNALKKIIRIPLIISSL